MTDRPKTMPGMMPDDMPDAMPDALNEAELDRWLEELALEARHATPEPSAELYARVLGDAEAVQAGIAQQAAAVVPARPVETRPWWMTVLASIGGGPGVAGLCTAMVAGIWFGYSPPDALSTSIDLSVLGGSTIDELVADDYLAIDDFLVDG
ncbi:dihydroorotate dehydrogenase [Alphaproteobacteria bacterium KMM 3653]|uniref:Dihydroorotate dehydrogenase n=1 Tax=Harenicola maris TaxID=2841044 RepID=A0AAP2G4X8_9RHOB|nr:dihydroorotate dehydrogenase [Harenicola maris]